MKDFLPFAVLVLAIWVLYLCSASWCSDILRWYSQSHGPRQLTTMPGFHPEGKWKGNRVNTTFPLKVEPGRHIQCLCSDPTGHHLFSGSLEEAMCQVKDNGHQWIIAINPVCMLNLQNVAHFQHFPRWGFKPSFCHPSDLPLLILFFFSLWFVTLCLFVSVSFLPSTNYSYL